MSEMYHHYGMAAEKIINGDFFFCMKMYEKAIIKKNDDRLFLRWLNGWDKTLSFDDFKNKLHLGPVKDESEEEVLDKVRKILGG